MDEAKRKRIGRFGALLQGAAGLFLIGLFGVVFLPGYDGGVARPVAAGATGVVFCGVAAAKLDERRADAGTVVAVAGALGTLAAASGALVTSDGALSVQLAVGSAVVGVVALAVTALAQRDRIDHVSRVLVEMGATGSVVATVVLLNLPPVDDEPFRTLYLVLGGGMAAYGAVVTVVSLLAGGEKEAGTVGI